MENSVVEVYTDGACCKNPGPGGWGVVMLKSGRLFEYGGSAEDTTNNIMEMTAALKALEMLAPMECPAVIRTDSQYLKKGITQWVHLWKVKGWKKADGDEIKNLDIWRELDRLNKPEIRWEWVKGHGDNIYNNRADEIATGFARNEPVELVRDGDPDILLKMDGKTTRGKVYLSLVGGNLALHSTWARCRAKTHNVPGVKFKACKNFEEQLETVKNWGLDPEVLNDLKEDEPCQILPDTSVEQDDPPVVSMGDSKECSGVVSSEEKGESTVLTVLTSLPLLELFCDNLIKKGFISESESPGLYVKEPLRVKVEKTGLFEISGPEGESLPMALKIADADSRYGEKFLSEKPDVFLQDPAVWGEAQLLTLMRPFLKGIVSVFEYTAEDGVLRASFRSTGEGFALETGNRPRWRTAPPAELADEIRAVARKSDEFADRALLHIDWSSEDGVSAVFCPFQMQFRRFSKMRDWIHLKENFKNLPLSEQSRIKNQIKAHLKNYRWQRILPEERETAAEKLNSWLESNIKKTAEPMSRYKRPIPSDIIMTGGRWDLFENEPLSAYVRDGKIATREPFYPDEEISLSLCAFLAYLIGSYRQEPRIPQPAGKA